MSELLERDDYATQVFRTVDEARQYLKSNTSPTFILADRRLENGEYIENRYLQVLHAAAPNSFVIVYTLVTELSPQDKLQIINAGAMRVLDKTDGVKLAKDTKVSEGEFGELLEIAQELHTTTNQDKDKFLAALIGAKVGLTIIDRESICWFENSIHKAIAGHSEREFGALCWKLFHSCPTDFGRCWGCNVPEVVDTGDVVQRLFLSRFADGTVSWVSVRSTPILSTDGTQVIAVREATTRVPSAHLDSMHRRQRLQRIAQGLIHVGFGRARIYQVEAGEKAVLRAAEARTDKVTEAESEYFERLRNLSLDYKSCPYVRKAIESRVGLFVSEWDEKMGGKSPLVSQLDQVPPYFIVPVWHKGKEPIGFIATDFVTEGTGLFEPGKEMHGTEETLTWLQSAYAREVRNALLSGASGEKEQPHYETVQRARLDIGEAQSVNETLKAVEKAFRELLPDTRVTVRTRMRGEEEILVSLKRLCLGPPNPAIPDVITMSDTTSLAVACVKAQRACWIDNWKKARQEAEAKGSPLGYVGDETISIAHIPLEFENVILGTLSIESSTPVEWEVEGFKGPLLELARLVALVVRDASLQEQLEKAHSDNAAITAYSVSQRGDEAWRYWIHQGLAEVSAAASRGQLLLKGEFGKEKIEEILEGITDAVGRIQRDRPPTKPGTPANLADVFENLSGTYKKINRVKFVPTRNLPPIQMPDYQVMHILRTLIDNSLDALPRSQTGNAVNLTAIEEGAVVRLIVEDNGPGLAPGVADRLFRGPIHSETREGTSLLIARGIALQYGGKLEYKPIERGARFDLVVDKATQEAIDNE